MPLTASKTTVVHVPALGISKQVTMLLVGGVVFAAAGIGFEAAIFNAPLAANAPVWLFHGLFGLTAILGCALLGFAPLEMIRRFDFHVDAVGLRRVSVCGPFRRERFWRRGDVVGFALRRWGAEGENTDLSTIVLSLSDGRSVNLIPFRPESLIEGAAIALEQALFPTDPREPFDRPPFGGGLTVTETPQLLKITAGPIPPQTTPGGLYTIGAMLCVGVPIFSLLITAAMWRVAGQGNFAPFFWFTMLGQLIILTTAGSALRRWIRKIASAQYEIAIDAENVTVTVTKGILVETRRCSVADVCDVERKAIVQRADGGLPLLERLSLVTTPERPIEILYGRPLEETEWLARTVRRRLHLPEEPNG